MMGKSTRFPNLRPKWMLTHPNGGFMGTEAISGIDLSSFSNVYFVTHKSYEDTYQFTEGFIKQLKEKNPNNRFDFLFLEEQTSSQPETVYEAIRKLNITGPILVKDSDNYFVTNPDCMDNYVCYFDLNDGNQFNAKNKSYIEFDNNGFISNIVEKKIISSTFSVGGYGFASAEEFCKYYERINHLTNEVYMSNIIFEMLLDGQKFTGIKTTAYEDWGTIDEWNRYKRTFRTLFVDIDGVLIENTSTYMKPFMGTGLPIIENIKLLQELYNEGRTKIILVTSRPSTHRKQTESELIQYDIPFDLLIMDLPHSQRIVINDFTNSNPFPSCNAINLERNSNTLGDYLT